MATKFNESVYSLYKVGENNQPINDYIITDYKDVVTNQDGSGNVIIYISDGEGVMSHDINRDKYTDLYIGDEHVAGGFGFKNINDRNYTYSYISYTLNEIDKIYDSISYISTNISDIENELNNFSNNIDSKNIRINQNKNYFYIDKKKYVLSINDNNLLSVTKESMFNVYDVKIYYNIIENGSIISENNCISLYGNNKTIIPPNRKLEFTKIIFNFEHSQEIKRYDILYNIIDEKTNDYIEQTLYGDEYSNNINNIFKLTDYDIEDSNIDLFSGQYAIELPNIIDCINLEELSDIKIRLIFRLTDKFNNYVDSILPDICIFNPIYYGIKVNTDTSLSSMYCDYMGTSNSLSLHFDCGDTEKYLVIYIPEYMYYLHRNNIKISLNKQLNIQINWNISEEPKSLANNSINFVEFISPYKYKGTSDWILSW
jgi:hypothetical protein